MTSPSGFTPHVLKVLDVGDIYRKKNVPQIKLQGKWLLKVGLRPDLHVKVTSPQTGVLVITRLENQA